MSSGPSSLEKLRERIARSGGWWPFEQFMATALYDPVEGYYTARVRQVGRTGDFSTSATRESILGRALARWAMRQKKRLPAAHPWQPWHLIEVGGGNGDLAFSILHALGWLGRLGLTYHLVEISPPLRALQEKALAGFQVCWHSDAAGALTAAKGCALLFSNELVDAWPCRRFQKSGGAWEEIGLGWNENGPVEITHSPSLDDPIFQISTGFALAGAGTIEVQSAYRAELAEIAKRWTHGVMLTIDYGERYPALYHRQPQGTVRGYFHHQEMRGPDLYQRMGWQDVTADVNFSDLENWGAELGWKNESLVNQRVFIVGELGVTIPKTTHEARLLDPVGAGGCFQVLQQSRGLL